MTPVLVDFESVSRANLASKPGDPGCGSRNYWAHPSTEAICCAWYDTRSSKWGIWFPGDLWPHDGRPLAAHNATGFDRFGFARYGWRPSEVVDTAHAARRAGLPGALDALAERWLGGRKDHDGSEFTKALSAVRRPTAKTAHRAPNLSEIDAAAWSAMSAAEKRELGVQPEITSDALDRVAEYNVSDVEVMRKAWTLLEPWLAVDAATEAADRVINDRGVRFDVELAGRLLDADARATERALEAAALDLGWSVERVRKAAGSQAQFRAETGAADARKSTVSELDHPLARARAASASIAAGKIRAGLASVSPDGRLRDTLRYYGAHTGRWGGAGFQPHNLTRPAARFEDLDPDDWVNEYLATGRELDRDEVSAMLRPLICASDGNLLVAADLNAVEARGVKWLAGDHDALAVHVSGRDPYKVAACDIFGVAYANVDKDQRRIGKTAELACGYQGGVGAFSAMARNMGLDLDGVDVGRIVAQWRKAHAPIVGLWRSLERAFHRAIEGHATLVACNASAPLRVAPSDDGRDVAIFLPSGRPIVYPHAAFDGTTKRGAIYWGAGEDDLRATAFCAECWLPLGAARFCECGAALRGAACPLHGKVQALRECKRHGLTPPTWRTQTYGGKLAENVTQAVCRDVLADALVRLEADGLPVVLHVHDEIVLDVPSDAASDALDHLTHTLNTSPSWGPDFPLGSSGWVGKRYRK